MTIDRSIRAVRIAGVLAFGAVAIGSGCASEPRAEAEPAPEPSRFIATWTPETSVRLVTIDRRVTVVPVDASEDLLILQERAPAYGPGSTWIVVAPLTTDGVQPVRDAWVVTDTYDGGRMARRARGSIDLRTLPDGALEGLAWLDPVEAGSGVEPLAYSGRFERWERTWTIPTPHLESRSGVTAPIVDPNAKDPKRTDPVWPWSEIFAPPPEPMESVGR